MNRRTLPLSSVPAPPRGPRPPFEPPPPSRKATFFGGATHLRQTPLSTHPLMAPMYWACADLLGLIPHFWAARGALPPASDLRAAVEQQLSTMMDRARSAGILPEDIVDAQYAIVALIDEVLARVQGWTGQAEWRTKPLQLLRFNENTAGENFFRRLAALEAQPHRAHVLQIYFLCMAVGFQGRYGVAGAEGLAPIYDRIGARVAQASGADGISPHGEPTEGRGLLQFEAPLVRLGLAFFGLALVVFLMFRVVLSMQVRDATRPMHDFASAASGPAAPGKH